MFNFTLTATFGDQKMEFKTDSEETARRMFRKWNTNRAMKEWTLKGVTNKPFFIW